jgi:nucleoside-diphosphate-sugar epimerase
VGQNLIIKPLANGFTDLHVIDKASHNLMLPAALADVDVVVLLHPQIGGIAPDAFHRNNVVATESVLSA